MLKTFLRKLFQRTPQLDFKLPPFSVRMTEIKEIQRAYARLFASADGIMVLEHLQRSVLLKATLPETSAAQLRFSEGQRSLVAQIMRHIAIGREN